MNLIPEGIMRYHPQAEQLAPASGHFAQSVREAVELIRHASVHLSHQERQFLDDLVRSEGRYQWRTMERLRAIYRRVPKELREQFAESFRAGLLADDDAVLPLHEALCAETRAESAADPAQLEAVLTPTSLEGIERAIAATRAQIAAGRLLLASLWQARFQHLQRRHA
ncbi:MAG: hypothetical protein H3C62_18455 [Gemmatimonadaceae bacterium]|nr:hypothetical protein [Gemmatimonadaceae bacterium]